MNADPALISFIEGIIHLTMSDQSFAEKYGRKICELQLAVLAQHRTAPAADVPALCGQCRTAAQQIVPGHPLGAITILQRSRTAGRQLSEIDRRASGSGGKAQKKQARGNQQLHIVSSPHVLRMGAACLACSE
ncbi:MAG TPA: hypothetical protein VGJ20_37825 [Xanthobacteraceae bacterium]